MTGILGNDSCIYFLYRYDNTDDSRKYYGSSGRSKRSRQTGRCKWVKAGLVYYDPDDQGNTAHGMYFSGNWRILTLTMKYIFSQRVQPVLTASAM